MQLLKLDKQQAHRVANMHLLTVNALVDPARSQG